jgi:hypothetical protein
VRQVREHLLFAMAHACFHARSTTIRHSPGNPFKYDPPTLHQLCGFINRCDDCSKEFFDCSDIDACIYNSKTGLCSACGSQDPFFVDRMKG